LEGPQGVRVKMWIIARYRCGFEFLTLKAKESNLISSIGRARGVLTRAIFGGSVSNFSSPDPMAAYSSQQIPYKDKPDITAPGCSGSTTDKSGTSISSLFWFSLERQ
jgi:hypothetical protein